MAELDLPAWSEPFVHDARAKLLRAAALRQLDREWAWGGATGAGVKVAIIDSGVEGDHPVVQGRLVESVTVQIVDDETQVVPDEPIDMYGHATACAGIVVGLAPEVEIYSVRVLGADLRGKGTDPAENLALLHEFRDLVLAERNQPHRLRDLAITGDDLLELGYPAGPVIGATLERLLHDVVGDPSLNRREWLLREAERLR